MALAFSPSFDLAGYQLGVGEIAILTGVGRDVINWINNASRDRDFLQLLGLDSETILTRKGLLNVVELGERWSQQVTIIQNGNLAIYHPSRDKAVKLPKLNYFTWFMTLVTAAFSSSMLESSIYTVLDGFFLSICEDDKQKDYSHRAVRKQMEGWKSTATVRGILQAARSRWKQLEDQRIHQPGLMPAADAKELTMFIRWLAGHPLVEYSGKEVEPKATHERFVTASSDVWAIAMVLDYLGISMQTVQKGDWFDGGRAVVIFDRDAVVYRGSNSVTKRRGVRINLTNVEEAVSLWPGSRLENTDRQIMFDRGTQAAKSLKIVAGSQLKGPDFSRGTCEAMLAVLSEPSTRRVDPGIVRLCREYLLGSDSVAIGALGGLVDSWKLSNPEREGIINKLAPYNSKHFSVSDIRPKILEDFQIFILGYYYAATRPLLDTSRMAVEEAFGAWTWNDMEFCELVRRMQKDRFESGTYSKCSVSFYRKVDLLKIFGYLYTGGEMHQIQKIGGLSCGIVSKLTLLDSTLMGDTDTPEKICRFCLIDVDGSCFPANAAGIVNTTGSEQPDRVETRIELVDIEDVASIKKTHQRIDFTSMVEPDWATDPQSCVVAFRYNGRIVSRVSPEHIFHGVLNGSPVSGPIYPEHDSNSVYRHYERPERESSQALQPSSLAYRLDIGAFEGETVPILQFPAGGPALGDYPLVCVPTSRLVKARACVAAVYPHENWHTLEHSIERDTTRSDGCSDATLILHHSSHQLLVL